MKKTLWIIPIALVIPLFAVTPQFWETRTYDEFRRGKLTNLSVTSDDDLVLGPRVETVYDTEQTLILSAVADSKGNVYLGTGHDGKIFKVDSAGQGSMIADLSELDVSALALDNKDVLYAGTSPDGKVYRIEPGKEASVFYDPDAKYIWALTFDKQGRLLVGTGDNGTIYRVNADGKGEQFYDTDETHVISMVLDKDGNLIAGGDPKGYIYRITPEGKAFVLFDSGMREVHALAMDSNGKLYAALLGGRPSNSAPASQPSGPSPAPTGEPTISITVGSAAVRQNVDVVEPVDQGASPLRSTPRRSASDSEAQSVILEIQPDGAVNTLWRSREELVFSMLPRGNKLLFSTGTKGRIYSIDGPHNSTLLLETTEEQTTKLLESGNRIYAATSNVAKLFSTGDTLATSGAYESTVKDTDAISAWGKISTKAEHPELVQIFTRSGNTSSPDRTWSDWTALDANGASSSPKARFIQWKAILRADGGNSPVVSSVTVPYLQQNFRPEVTSVDVLPSGVALIKTPALNSSGIPINTNDPATLRANARSGQSPGPRIAPRRVNQRGAQSFQWTATDRNEDMMRYDLYYRGEGERAWKLLKKDLEDNFYTINSDSLPDGIYVVRVVASDSPSNPVELALSGETESRAFTIDNTPPTVNMKQESIEKGRVRIAIAAADTTSTLNQAEVSIDAGEWRPIFPTDGIMDSKTESFTYVSGELPPGEHVIAFRVYDQNDNAGMNKLVVKIP
jgi:hypothetical protein